jgi:hypothetical protein
MRFFEVFFPAFAAMWLLIGLMCINPGIREAESAPWGSEKEGGDLTKLGYVVVAIYYVITGPFRAMDFISTRP